MKTSLIAVALLMAPVTVQADPPQDGDIVFQQSRSRQSRAIGLATGSRYTHVGVVFVERGLPYVYEAIGPVKKTPLKRWIDRGKEDHYVRKRLKNRSGLDWARLKGQISSFMGRPYDWGFHWSDEKIYCSELVWKAYDKAFGVQVGKLKKLKDFNLKHPVVKEELEKRYKDNIPYDMTVISPADMFESDLLITVTEE